MACFLSLVPNINPDYPLFNFIFKAAGFYIIPTIFGFIISAVLIMISLALISSGLHKIYYKYYAKDEPQIIVMSPEEFIKKVQEENVESNIQSSLEEKENKKDDSE